MGKIKAQPILDTPSALGQKLIDLGFRAKSKKADAQAVGSTSQIFKKDDFKLRLTEIEAAGLQGAKLEGVGRYTKGLGTARLAGFEFPLTYWRKFEERRDKIINRYEQAVATVGKREPIDLTDLKHYLNYGRSLSKQQQIYEHQAELTKLQIELSKTIAAVRAAGRAPSRIILYTEGPDAAGKTSTGDLIRPPFEANGYTFREHAFKAPSKAESHEHWLERFKRQMPAEGEIVRWDRGPAGNAAYTPISDDTRLTMATEFLEMQRNLVDENVLWLGYYLHRDILKQASTFGGREARAQIARSYQFERQKKGLPPAETLRPLINALGLTDLKASTEFADVHANFMKFLTLTHEVVPWRMIDTSQRHKARVEALKAAQAAILDFQLADDD